VVYLKPNRGWHSPLHAPLRVFGVGVVCLRHNCPFHGSLAAGKFGGDSSITATSDGSEATTAALYPLRAIGVVPKPGLDIKFRSIRGVGEFL
jgi:hypothetical protein